MSAVFDQSRAPCLGKRERGLRLLSVVPLVDVDIAGLFELAQMRAEIAPGEPGLLQQVRGVCRFDDEEIGHDRQPRRFVDESVDLRRYGGAPVKHRYLRPLARPGIDART